jgi:aryl-alcohol dehydrogenase-like predicted oxidoreductase
MSHIDATRELAGHRIHRIGLGVMGLAHAVTAGTIGRDAAISFLRDAVAAGVDHVDTAGFYDDANVLLREALGARMDEVLIATKIGAVGRGRRLEAAQRPAELRTSIDDNRRSLGVDRLDLVYLRRADGRPGIIATGDQLVPIEDQLAELVALRDAGAIGAIGLSNVDAERLARALPAGVVAIQNSYSAVDRTDEALLTTASEHGIAWAPYMPLGSGFAGMPKVADQPAVIDAAAELGATAAQVGLAWLLQHDPAVVLIAGTSSLGHLRENLAAGTLRLPPAQVAAIDAVAASVELPESLRR